MVRYSQERFVRSLMDPPSARRHLAGSCLECYSVAVTRSSIMNMRRRTVIKAGLGLGASLLLRPRDIFAQAQPLVQKKIPSTGESIPIIGLGTARRYEHVKTDAE